MNFLYLDASSGLSGDMWLAGLVALGWDAYELQKLVNDWLGGSCAIKQQVDEPIQPWTFRLDEPLSTKAYSFTEQRDLIGRAPVPQTIRDTSLAMLEKLADAEAVVHGCPKENVHFHELKQADTMIDLVGVPLGLLRLHCSQVYCSPLELGSGSVSTAHGQLPVPAPATAHILQGIPVHLGGLNAERTTPTGAVLASSLVDSFTSPPPGYLLASGYSGGERPYSPPSRLGLFLCRTERDTESCWHLATNIDDVEPRILGYLCEQLLTAGASDAWLTPIVMKKSRSAQQLNVLVTASHRGKIEELIFREVPTFGIRSYPLSRVLRESKFHNVKTPWGDVQVRCGYEQQKLQHLTPEYEECKKIAHTHGLSLHSVFNTVRQLGHQQLSP